MEVILSLLENLPLLKSVVRLFRKRQDVYHEIIETETVDITYGNPTRIRHSRQRHRTFLQKGYNMSFWEDYLKKPPFEVTFEATGESTDSHAVLRRGYESFDFEELWDFGSGMSWNTYPPPLPSFVEHGGHTLCGLRIHSGEDIYGPRLECV